MCCLCDIEEIEEGDMAEPWEGLKDQVLAVLEEGIKDLSKDLLPQAKEVLHEIAVQAAKEKWRSIHAETEEERNIAESNLRHLKGQATATMKLAQLSASHKTQDVLKKVLEVSLEALVRIGPSVLMKG